jgi:hypothetical protein
MAAHREAKRAQPGRPRLLLVPLLTELEWAISPRLEQWAQVASFDAPGVGEEPAAEPFGRDAVARRGLAELDRRAWDSCVLVADGEALPSAVRLAELRPEAVKGMALGHARLANTTEGERPTINGEVLAAFGQLVRENYRAFVRHALTQVSRGSWGEELAERMLQRIPSDVAAAAFDMVLRESEPIQEPLARLGVPLLLARHEGCIVATDEGFEDAVAAFPAARTVSVPDAPPVSAEFAETLRSFCARVAEGSVAARP